MCLMVTDFLRRTSFPQTCCVSVNAKRFPINLEATNRKYSPVVIDDCVWISLIR